MNIQQIKSGFDIRHNSTPRSTGKHLSGVLKARGLATGRIKIMEGPELNKLIDATSIEDVGESSVLVRISIGLAWEDWLGKRLPMVSFHPGELFMDGIISTPDGIGMTDGMAWIEEYKATYKSANRNIAEEWSWIEQCKGGCKMAGLNIAILRVLYINGTYGAGGGNGNGGGRFAPLFRSYMFTFDQAELDHSWEENLKYLGQAEEEVY